MQGIIINLGLRRSRDNGLNDWKLALVAFRSGLPEGCKVIRTAVQPSTTEDTLVVVLDSGFPGFRDWVYTFAQLLDQDCIACYAMHPKLPGGGKGELIGPKAAEWGDFDPDKFLLLDGQPLSKPPIINADGTTANGNPVSHVTTH